MRMNETLVKGGIRTLHEVAREHVMMVLAAMNGNKLAAARVLGISRKKLYAMLGPERKPPHASVKRAILSGLLPPIESQICRDCGAPAYCYDHRDYRYPLLVEPVCNRCNLKRGGASYGK